MDTDSQRRTIPAFILKHFSSDTAERACRILWEIEKTADEGAKVRNIKPHVAVDYQAIKYILKKLEKLNVIESLQDEEDSRAYVYKVTPLYAANIGSLRAIYDRGFKGASSEESDYSFVFYNRQSEETFDINTMILTFSEHKHGEHVLKVLAGMLVGLGVKARGYYSPVDKGIVRKQVEFNLEYFEMMADIHRQLLNSDYLMAPGMVDETVNDEIYSPLTKDRELPHKEVAEKTGLTPEIAAHVLKYLLNDPMYRHWMGPLKVETAEVTVSQILYAIEQAGS